MMGELDTCDGGLMLRVNGPGFNPDNASVDLGGRELNTQKVVIDGIAVSRSILVSDAAISTTGLARLVNSAMVLASGSTVALTSGVVLDDSVSESGGTRPALTYVFGASNPENAIFTAFGATDSILSGRFANGRLALQGDDQLLHDSAPTLCAMMPMAPVWGPRRLWRCSTRLSC